MLLLLLPEGVVQAAMQATGQQQHRQQHSSSMGSSAGSSISRGTVRSAGSILYPHTTSYTITGAMGLFLLSSLCPQAKV